MPWRRFNSIANQSYNDLMFILYVADIDKYVEPRYRIATEVCHTVMEFLDTMSSEDRHK